MKQGFIVLISMLMINLLGFSQSKSDQKDQAIAGPNGVLISLINAELGLTHFNPDGVTTIYRLEEGLKEYAKLTELRFPRTLAEFKKRLGKELLDSMKEFFKMKTDQQVFDFMLNNPIEHIGFFATSFEYMEAFGLVYLDKTWVEKKAVNYRVDYSLKGEPKGQIYVYLNGTFPSYTTKFDLINNHVTDSVAALSWGEKGLANIENPFLQAVIYKKKGNQIKYEIKSHIPLTPSEKADSNYIYFRDEIQPGFSYSYYAELRDWAGNFGSSTDTVFALAYDRSKVSFIQNLASTAKENGILLSWKALPAQTIYSGIEILKSRNYDSAYVVIDTVLASDVQYLDTRILHGASYYYRVKPLFVSEIDEDFILYSETTGSLNYLDTNPPPLKPEGIKAIATEYGIKINWWTSDELDVYGYYVLRGVNANSMEVITDAIQDTVYVDTLVSKGFSGQYLYAIQAMNQNQQLSDTSDYVSADIRQPLMVTPPGGVSTRQVAEGIYLTWNNVMEVDDNVSSYVVFRKKKGDKEFRALNEEVLVFPYYLDNTYHESQEYEYAVSSKDIMGNYSILSALSTIGYANSFALNPPALIYLRNLTKGIEVSWPTSLTATKANYIVYRKKEGDSTFDKVGQTSSSGSFIDYQVTKGVAYEYNVLVSSGTEQGEASLSKTMRR